MSAEAMNLDAMKVAILKILRINTYLQIEHGTLYLDGKELLCVALDHSYALVERGEGMLTDEQLEILFQQTCDSVQKEQKQA